MWWGHHCMEYDLCVLCQCSTWLCIYWRWGVRISYDVCNTVDVFIPCVMCCVVCKWCVWLALCVVWCVWVYVYVAGDMVGLRVVWWGGRGIVVVYGGEVHGTRVGSVGMHLTTIHNHNSPPTPPHHSQTHHVTSHIHIHPNTPYHTQGQSHTSLAHNTTHYTWYKHINCVAHIIWNTHTPPPIYAQPRAALTQHT
jgi:hypothetical protein